MSFITAALDTANELIGDLAGNYALISSPNRYIGDIFLPDTTVRETHNDEFVVTQFPVETGTPVSDHYFAAPKQVEVLVGYTDDGHFAGYTVQAYSSIIALAKTRQAFDVSTGKRLYQNMMIVGVSTITDEQFESAGVFTIRLQEVIISSTDGGADLSADDQADPQSTAPSTDMGTQALSNFDASGPITSTGSDIAGSTAITGQSGFISGGGGLSFDSYIGGFSSTGSGFLPSTVDTPGGGIGRA